jgi:23S rRNA (guanosine2251-2'-O)-methyltransferase
VIVYGRNPVVEALRGWRAQAVSDIWATAAAAREPWLGGVAVRVVAAAQIEQRCGSPTHQGVCADAGPYPYRGADEILARTDPLIVALDQVQDPQNLGSICRSAECVGAAGVVILDRRAAAVTPAVCKASAGAVEHVRVARVRNLADFLADARRAGCWCYGASAPAYEDGANGHRGPGQQRCAHARRAAVVPYDEPDYKGGVVLVLGSEGRGLRPRVASQCDQLVALPQLGRVQSLGVSAAAAALLYEILQDRGGG